MCYTKDSGYKPYLWFDIDDTLWDMSGNSVIALSAIFGADPTVRRCFGRAGLQAWLDCYHSVNIELWDLYNRGAIDRDYLRLERFARPLRFGGCSEYEAADVAARLDIDYLDRLGACTALVPGAKELLDTLASNGYRMGLLSNGFKEVQYRKLISGGIDGYFDPIVLSDDIGVNKPDKRLFEYALECAGTDAGASVLIGDNPQTDIVGALAAGWAALWFNPGDKPVPEALVKSSRFLGCAGSLTDISDIIVEKGTEKCEKTI